jgi:hypothetical protein
LLSAQKFTISGIVKDSLSGENLDGTSIFVNETKQGVLTNKYGFFSISLPNGVYNLSFSFLGYKNKVIPIELNQNIQINTGLVVSHSELSEVIISSAKTNVENMSVSSNELSTNRIKTITTSTGEPDVLKALQLLPGIQAANEGATNLYVRGGSYDQNLYLLDEAPVYNPAHALGFFSTFNPDVLKNVNIYKGCFPARYGGRLSSVVDIAMREGNDKKNHANVGIGLIASRLTIEGPIVKEKASFIVSGRISYPGLALNALSLAKPNTFSDNNKIWFYDLNAKVNYNINANNHIYFSMYSGYDNFYCITLNNKNELNWGNFTSTIRWNHIFSSKLFSNFTIYHSKYNYAYTIREDIRNFVWKSNISETGAKADFTYYPNLNNNVKTGMSCIYHSFEPGLIKQADTSSIIKEFSLDEKRSAEFTFYLENEQSINSWLSLNYGFRSSFFTSFGPSTVYSYNDNMTQVIDSTIYTNLKLINTYKGIEPRVSARFKINKTNAVKLAYSYTIQYLHLLSNSTVGLPTDVWLPPDKYTGPQASHQFVMGYYSTFVENKLEFSVETYYKDLINIIDFKDNADLFLNKHIETQILKGNGRSYGIEFLIEKESGKFSGWIGYTLAKTQYKIAGVNNGNYYSPRYDIRHNLTFTGSYELSKSWAISSTFKLTSGGYITLPQQIFLVDGVTFFDYGNKNSYKMPAYHRLDFSAIYKSPKNDNRRVKSQWVLSIYNIYNKKNIYSLFVKQNAEDFTMVSAYKMYLFGIVPAVSYNLKF